MSIEAFNPTEARSNHPEKIRAVEAAVDSITQLRALITEVEERLKLEESKKPIDAVMVAYLRQRLQELAEEIQDPLAFLEEFDPVLYQKLKDNS